MTITICSGGVSLNFTSGSPSIKGHFCSSGATEPAPVSQMYGDICPAGYYCPEQSSAPLPCPVGFILQDKGATSSNDCSPCPPRRYCTAPGSSQPSGWQIINITLQTTK